MFHPLNEDHAIGRVKFVLLFTRPITPKSIFEIERQHDKWREAMPARSRLEVDVDVNGGTTKAPAVVFAFLKPDANPTWSMQIGGSQIEIECFLYSRWERVWGAARHYLTTALEELSFVQEKLMVSAMHLTVEDVFLSSDDEFVIGDVLNKSDKIPPFALKAGGPWNSYFSWIVEENQKVRTLHACDIDVSVGSEDGRVAITHAQTRNTGVDLPINEVCGDGFARLDAMMEEMHASNKALMRDLITVDLNERIGLGRK